MLKCIFLILMIPQILLSGENSWTTNGPLGASVRSLATHPSDPSMIFLGTLGGGFYKSEDSGEVWNLNNNNLIRGKPITSNIITTGNMVLVASFSTLYKSIDLGDNWEILFKGAIEICSIAIHPTNNDIIYIGIYGGFEGSSRIYKTIDGGMNWVPIGQGISGFDINDIKISNINPDHLFIATYNGVFMSADGGESEWQNISGNLPSLPISAITLDSTDSNKVFVGTGIGVYKTMDRGKNWQNITENIFKNRFIDLQALTAFGNDGQNIFAGTKQGLYKSTDGGSTWEEKNSNLTNTSINYILPIDDDKILLGTDDGFYASDNGGASWYKKINGLMAFNNTSIAFSTQSNPSKILTGTEGAGIYCSDDTGQNWTDVDMDTGFTKVMDLVSAPSNSQIMYASYIGKTDSTITQTGLLKSTDGGHSWFHIGEELRGKFIRTISVDYYNPDIVFIGTRANKIYKSTDGGLTWANKNIEPGKRCNISSIAIDPLNSNNIYAGIVFNYIDHPHGIYKSIDFGESWERSYQGLPMGIYFHKLDICINPINPRTIYLALDALDQFGIYKSKNGAASWDKISNGIGSYDDRINSITIDPQDTNRVYAAGTKIYTSENAGQTWQEMMEGLPEYYGFINEIRLDPNDPSLIYAAAEGYGVLTYYHKPTSDVNDHDKFIPSLYVLFQNHPNPFNPSTMIPFQIPKAANVTIKIYNVKGNIVRTLVNENKSAGHYTVQWDGLDESGKTVASGVYICRMTAGNFTDVKKLVLAM